MKITYDENGYLTGFVTLGDIDGSVPYDGAVPEGFSPVTMPFHRLVDGSLVFDADRQAAAQNAETLRVELDELLAWFLWYDSQVSQYNRAKRFADTVGETFEGDISDLDSQARDNQLRIREIRQIIG